MDEPKTRARAERIANALKITSAIALITATATSVYILATRLSDEALAVLAGTVIGAAASIPLSLLITLVILRLNRQHNKHSQPANQTTGQVLVIPPMTYQQPPPLIERPQIELRHEPTPRIFTVVGGGGGNELGD